MYQFEKLDVWKTAQEIIAETYKLTKGFPDTERFGLISQLQRAAISIALNIAEGRGSGSDPEFARFLNISLRSLFELVAGFKVSINLGYLNDSDCQKLFELCDFEGAKIKSLRNHITGKKSKDGKK